MNLSEIKLCALFRKANRKTISCESDVYWSALDAERDGLLTIGEMDAIICIKEKIASVFSKEAKS